MYQHCASCIPLSHANRSNVLQKCQVIRVYRPNASIEISAHDWYVTSLNTSIDDQVQHIIHLFHCTIFIPSRRKVNTENSEPPDCLTKPLALRSLRWSAVDAVEWYFCKVVFHTLTFWSPIALCPVRSTTSTTAVFRNTGNGSSATQSQL